MGALTESRKPFTDVFTLTCSLPPPLSSDSDCTINLPPAKRARTTSMPSVQDQPMLSHTSGISIIKTRSFPALSPLPRSVLAPQRNSKFSRSLNSERKSQLEESQVLGNKGVDEMGNVLTQYKQVKSNVLPTSPWYRNGKSAKDVACEGLSVGAYKKLVQRLEDHLVVSESSREVGQSSKLFCSPSQPSSPSAADLTILTPRKDAAEQLVHYLSPDNVAGDTVNSTPVYKILLENSRVRDTRFNGLDFELKLNEKKLSAFKLFFKRPTEEAKEDVTRDLFTPLTEQEEDDVSRALRGSNSFELLVTHESSNIEITREKMQCLRPGAWLNDEVINLYLELLKERERSNPTKILKCHFFNTFFYKKLISGRNGYDYKAVRRWTTPRKIGYGLIDCDKIFVPIHAEIHWCLAVINIKDEKFQYLDSLGCRDIRVLNVLAKYLVDETKDKSNKDIDVSSWEQEFVEDLPEQQNGWDCGMFMIKYADFYSRGLDLCFSQEHMPYFRRRTAKEILQLKAD
ncbi:ubiquitin-like-specific protease ESD4 [Aristolochia californica]|uniref:ubiquitin-like-specific protease ESD4 n=1 Tax=Aristolochia californica TaxID=171875 RepID=UPI0035E34FBE